MPLCHVYFAFLYVILCFTIQYNVADYQGDTIADVVARFCPKVDICDRQASSAELLPNGKLKPFATVSCCHGCSCHPDCKRYKNCCYQIDYEPRDDDVTLPICTRMRIGPSDKEDDSDAYYIISTEPSSGCANNRPFQTISGELSTPSCGVQSKALFGDFFPVFSGKTKEIFKNEECARCHGVIDYELFRPSVVCDRVDHTHVFSLREHIRNYENGSMSPECYMEYDHPNISVLRHKRCMVDDISTCPTNTTSLSPAVTDLSIDVVQRECEHGIDAPVILGSGIYRNVFCFICNVGRNRPIVPTCNGDSTQKTGDQKTISVLLDARHVTSKMISEVQDEKTNHPVACLPGKESLIEASCRTITCPTGMARSDQGDCIFISTTWITAGFSIYVKLSPAPGTTPLHDDNTESLVDRIIEGNPWPPNWSIVFVLQKRKDGLRQTDGMFVVVLETNQKTFSAEEFINDIKLALTNPWNAAVNGSFIQFKQSILEYDLSAIRSIRLTRPFWTTTLIPNWTNISIEKSAMWEIKDTRLVRSKQRIPFLIDKMFFCEQVVLRPDEFEFIVDRYLIKSHLNGRILFDKEFKLGADETGNEVLRVCLSDTPLVATISGCCCIKVPISAFTLPSLLILYGTMHF